MTYQQTELVFDKPKKRQHRETSKAAHDSVKEHKAIFYEKIIAAFERLRIGATSMEIAKEAGIEYCQAHKRIPELVDAGVLFNTGVTRVNPSGRKSMVRQLVKLRS